MTFLLEDEYKSFLGIEAYEEIVALAREELAPKFADIISGIADHCDTDDPEGYFEDSSESLAAMEMLFPHDAEVQSHVEAAYDVIQETVDEINEKTTNGEDDEDHWAREEERGTGYQVETPSEDDDFPEEIRSVFDDIDS